MKDWDFADFEDYLQPKTKYTLILGNMLVGKTSVAKILVNHLGYKLLDLAIIEEKIKKSKGTEEEPFEGDITEKELADDILKLWEEEKKNEVNCKYVLDNYNIIKTE